MKIKILFACAWLLAYQAACSQTCPPNIDFEKGDFSSWEVFTGTTEASLGQNLIHLSPSLATAGRHEIITAASLPKKDPYGNFPTLCPYGGGFSVKLGNNNTGSEAEGVSYTFTIPTTIDTFTFTYFYAVVFEDPGHLIEEQPRFFVTAYEVETGNLINCASYTYVSNGTLPGFQVSPANAGVLYRNWSPTSLQFAGLQGKEVRLEFKTADCTLGGHFGYAYLDVGSACSNIMATAPYCRETNSLLLNAPYGFKTYTWYNETYADTIGSDQFLTLSPPPATKGIFYVDVIPYPGYGCRDTLQAIVTPLPVPDTPVAVSSQMFCQFERVAALEAQVLPGNDLLWYTTASGGIPGTMAPVPSTANAGSRNYYVSQKVLFGCESFRKEITVTVKPTPLAFFTLNNTWQCLATNQYQLTNKTNNLYKPEFTWDFGDGKKITSTEDTMVTHAYAKSGMYSLKLSVSNDSSCSTEHVENIFIVPKPLALFDYPSIICEAQTQVTLTDRSYVPERSWVDKWWWNIDGRIVTGPDPGTFTVPAAGTLPVKLVVASPEGCLSDTTTVNMMVYHKPVSAFDYSRTLCDNEMISFSDRSFIPSRFPSESIVRYNWTFGSLGNSYARNPAFRYMAGPRQSRLITETNFGCVSVATDSFFTIHEKPQARLDINDSCVFRTIRYSAADLKGSVHKYYWNFGSGFNEGPASYSKTYMSEGDRSLTLLAKTVHGCNDTIIRPFAIYDNKVFAGRDTIVAMDEPVQLDAQGGPGAKFLWSPSTGLNDPTAKSPVALWEKDVVYNLDAWTKEGCDSHTRILVKRYKGPDIYIPNAFTPNQDGKNDLLKVFPVGFKTFNFFAVYNRWGEMVFRSNSHLQGWDGRYKNNEVSGSFVVVAQAIDYKGRLMLKKGTVTVIR